MDTDDATTIDDPDETAWVAEQRQTVIEYLTSQQCNHHGVSLEPHWFVSPYVALWAVRSPANPERVGWWAISGDLPTDYLTAAAHLRSSGDVLIAFAHQWRAAADQMKDGRQMDEYTVGDPSCATDLATLLETRANLLQQFGEELNNAEKAGEG